MMMMEYYMKLENDHLLRKLHIARSFSTGAPPSSQLSISALQSPEITFRTSEPQGSVELDAIYPSMKDDSLRTTREGSAFD
jgi:hypothetical protein